MDEIEIVNSEQPLNGIVNLINELFAFRHKHDMLEESLLIVISEYCRHNNLDTLQFCEELSELPQMVDILEIDCLKHKYIKKEYKKNSIKFEDYC